MSDKIRQKKRDLRRGVEQQGVIVPRALTCKKFNSETFSREKQYFYAKNLQDSQKMLTFAAVQRNEGLRESLSFLF